jgi:hypothetical protein
MVRSKTGAIPIKSPAAFHLVRNRPRLSRQKSLAVQRAVQNRPSLLSRLESYPDRSAPQPLESAWS